MACNVTLDLSPAPAPGSHLSFYWTMDEAGDLNKVDSVAAHVWNATTGNSSPPGLFVNGVQLDTAFVGGAPFYHGLTNFDDLGLAFDSATSTGISYWFWIKQTTPPVNPELPFGTFFEFDIECHDPGYAPNDCEIFTTLDLGSNGSFGAITVHKNFTDSTEVDSNFTFNPGVGWRMIAVTLDLVAHTLNTYVDAVLVKSDADIIGFLTAPQGDLILKYSFGSPHLGVVLVDEFGLSLKGALTQAQITALYNGGSGLTWPNITPIVPYP